MEKAGVLFVVVLLFALVGGLTLIFVEEVQEIEFFGRLHTTALPSFNDGGAVDDSVSHASVLADRAAKQGEYVFNANAINVISFTGRGLYTDGRIVDDNLKPIHTIRPGTTPLHTITGGVNDYFARGFLRIFRRDFIPHHHMRGTLPFLIDSLEYEQGLWKVNILFSLCQTTFPTLYQFLIGGSLIITKGFHIDFQKG